MPSSGATAPWWPFILLTGARDGAVVSLKLKHLDLVQSRIIQDAREVATKFGKSFDTYFFPVGDDVRLIVEEWVEYLGRDLLRGPDDPLFPATRMDAGPDRLFHAVGLERKHWSSAGPIREVFRRAFAAAGLPYFAPHRLRNTLVALGSEALPHPGGIQGLEPRPRPQPNADDIHELRERERRPASRVDAVDGG